MSAATQVPIAVIGMACRTPGANDIDAFWRMLVEGRTGLRTASVEELRTMSVPSALVDHDSFVPVAPELDEPFCFDAEYFGVSPMEAALIDPQIRIGLETAHAAFDDAAVAPGPELGAVGCFVGASLGTYLLDHLASDRDGLEQHGGLRLLSGNDRDHLAGQISYRLDLRGPPVAVGAACASSLVAIDIAARRLAEGELEYALAGGVSLHFPLQHGYLHQAGSIYSREGKCRAFDQAADGVTPGAGAAMVLLRRLDDAIASGDPIRAVLLGSAVSGDGGQKLGYSAPSENGQLAAISRAWERASVKPETAGLIEGHGTGTSLGDAIEIAALSRALSGARCDLGSVKSNIGHLDVAAGAISFIKVALALEKGIVPPTLHVTKPMADLAGSSAEFTLPTTARLWPDDRDRIAGVSSFGIGGANAHAVLAAFDAADTPLGDLSEANGPVPLGIAAADAPALGRLAKVMLSHLRSGETVALEDLALTLAVRAGGMPQRAITVVGTIAEACDWLEGLVEQELSALVADTVQDSDFAAVAHAFVEDCDSELLIAHLQEMGAKRIHLPPYPFARTEFRLPIPERHEAERTVIDQPLKVLIERSLATAETVQTIARRPGLTDALNDLCHAVAWQSLLTLDGVRESQVRDLAELSGIANADPSMQPLLAALHTLADRRPAGLPNEDLEQAKQVVTDADPAFAPLAELLAGLAPQLVEAVRSSEAGESALYGGVNSTLLADTFASLPEYREVGRVADAVAAAIAQHAALRDKPLRILEFGAGTGVLSRPLADTLQATGTQLTVTDEAKGFVDLLHDQLGDNPNIEVRRFDIMREPLTQGFEEHSFDLVLGLDVIHVLGDLHTGLQMLRRLLRSGGQMLLLESSEPTAWDALIWGRSRHWWQSQAGPLGPLRGAEEWRSAIADCGLPLRVDLAEPASMEAGSDTAILLLTDQGQEHRELADWFYAPTLSPVSPRPSTSDADERPLVVIAPQSGPASQIVDQVWQAETPMLICHPTTDVDASARDGVTIEPDSPEQLRHAIEAAGGSGRSLRIVHAASLLPDEQVGTETRRRLGYQSLVALAKALAGTGSAEGTSIVVLTEGICSIRGDEAIDPAACLIDGPVQLLPRELPGLTASRLDLCRKEFAANPELAAQEALKLLQTPPDVPLVALRGHRLWREALEHICLESKADPARLVQPGTSVLVAGGVGAMGAALGQAFADVPSLTLLVASRSLPDTEIADLAALQQLRDKGEIDQQAQERLAELAGGRASLQLCRLDIGDAEALARLDRRMSDAGRPIRAVIHAAGTPDRGGIMSRRDRVDDDVALRAKLGGVAAINQVYAGRNLDLIVLCASLGSFLPRLKFGEVGYVAANLALSRGATALRQGGCGRALAISWTDWAGSGMWHEAQQRLRSDYDLREEQIMAMPDLLSAISPDQGRQAFHRALSMADTDHLLVCAQPLARLLKRHDAYGLEDHEAFLDSLSLKRRRKSASKDSTPAKEAGADAPPGGGDISQRLTAIWRDLLGIDEIGLDDDFFELGGDSLLGIRILNRLREDFGVSDSLVELMETPTIRSLSARVEALSKRDGDHAGADAEKPDRSDEMADGFTEIRL